MPLHSTAAGAGTERPVVSEPRLGGMASRLRRDPGAVRVPQAWRLPLLTYLACQIILFFWWAAYYPGPLTYDSVTYVIHVTTGPWVNNHSVTYDALVWLSLHLTGGVAALSLAQAASMSAALGWSVAAFRRLGVPGRWTALAALAVAALPPLASFTIRIWKDVPFALCSYLVLPTLACLLPLVRAPSAGAGGRRVRLLAALGLELFGVCLFRLNGFAVAGIATVVLVLLLPGVRARVAALGLAAVVVTAVLNMYLFPALGIRKTPSYLAMDPVYSDIAVAYRQDPGIFTPTDLRLMAQVVPLAQWRSTADCYSSDRTALSPHFTGRAAGLSGPLLALAGRVAWRAPQVMLGATICRGAIAWSVFPGPPVLDGATRKYWPPSPVRFYGANRVRGNPYAPALWPRPLSFKAYAAATFLWKASLTPQLDWLLWRGAFWCYLAYLAVWLLSRARQDRRLLALAAIPLAQQITVLAENHVQAYRYMVSVIPIGIMLVPLLLARKRAGSQVTCQNAVQAANSLFFRIRSAGSRRRA
jgi:hypothetical protein